MPTPKTTPTNTELNLLATVLAGPADAVALEVYADYLQEQGEARAEDEKRVRAEAQAIRDGTAPPTFEQLRALGIKADRKDVREWRSRQEGLLKRVICAALPGRAKLIATERELRLEVDGEPVGVSVYWSSAATDRATCHISAFQTRSRPVLRGKRGWVAQTILAHVLKQAGTGQTRRETDTARRARNKQLGDAIGKMNTRFNLRPRALGVVWNADTVRLTLDRAPDQMERVLQVLSENGLLKPDEKEEGTPAPQ